METVEETVEMMIEYWARLISHGVDFNVAEQLAWETIPRSERTDELDDAFRKARENWWQEARTEGVWVHLSCPHCLAPVDSLWSGEGGPYYICPTCGSELLLDVGETEPVIALRIENQ